jgi:hypothetical protein
MELMAEMPMPCEGQQEAAAAVRTPGQQLRLQTL